MIRNIRVITAYFLLCSLFLCVISDFNRLDHDMLHELSLAREAVELGRVPWQDSFSYAATVDPVVHHEWGTGLLIYALVVLTGWGAAGLMAVKFALSFSTFGLSVRSSRHGGGAWPVILVLSPVAIVLACIGFQTIRAQLFTLLFTAVLLNLFALDRKGRTRWTWFWLALYVVWLNLHAGFLVGIGLFGCHLIERTAFCYQRQRSLSKTWRQTRHLYFTLCAMSVLWLANPYLWHYGSYLVYAVRLERPRVSEWRWIGADEASATVLLPTYGIALLLLGYSASQRRWTQLPGLLMVAVTAWLSFRHVRHISIFALVWFAYVPGYLSATGLGRLIRKPWKRFPVSVPAAMLAVGLLALWKPVNEKFWQLRMLTQGATPCLIYPVGVVDYLEKHHFSGNLMVPFCQGSYFSWKMAPDVKVSVDSRYEVAYDPEWVERTFRLYEVGEGWQSVMNEYPTDAILVETDSALMQALQDSLSDEWKLRYEDPSFSLFFSKAKAGRYPAEQTADIPTGRFP